MRTRTMPAEARTVLAAGLMTLLIVGCNDPQSDASLASGIATADEVVAERAQDDLPGVTGDPAFARSIDDPSLDWLPCPEFMPESCGLAVLNGDVGARNADVFFRLAPGTTVDEHWHTSTERMVLVAGRMEVDYEGQGAVEMTAGTYAYGPAGLAHETHCLGAEGDDDCVLFIAFEDEVDATPVVDQSAPGSSEYAFTRTVEDVNEDGGWAACPPFMPEGCEMTILRGAPEEPNADVFFRLLPDTEVPLHWHTSAERMVLVSGDLRVNYQGQPPTDIGANVYAYGPAELPHITTCRDQADDCVLFIAFEEAVDAHDVRGGTIPHGQ